MHLVYGKWQQLLYVFWMCAVNDKFTLAMTIFHASKLPYQICKDDTLVEELSFVVQNIGQNLLFSHYFTNANPKMH